MYKLLLMSHEGNFVTEGSSLSKEEAAELSANMGSRWIFYPYHFIIKDNGHVKPNQRIIEAPYELPFLKGKSIMNVQTLFRSFQ